jgi:succinylglutamic semialdehyde dehydrogenase
VIFRSINPATGEPVWTGSAASPDEIDHAAARARAAFASWSRRPGDERAAILRAFAARLHARGAALAALISAEIGKTLWEALAEVQSMIGKIELSIEAHARRCGDFVGGPAITRFRPHGVVAVLGPFNFPGHLPNGHIAPALLAGNTVLFKPSEHAPGVAELVRECWLEAGLPDDALVVLQGGRETGEHLARHPGVDGLFFTGGAAAGRALAELFSRRPGKILALELGGNNPLVVWPPLSADASALAIVQSAYLGAGQRCTCARRLIVPEGAAGDEIVDRLLARIDRLRVGHPFERPEPFLGPLVSAGAADRVLLAQAGLISRGARALAACRPLAPALLTPGLLDVTGVPGLPDEEIFGPLLQVLRVPGFPAALAEANRTAYGLAAGLLCDDPALYSVFRDEIRAGIVNWNQPLTGASGAAPFGGLGASGNHRPGGYFAADYCSHPVASIEVPALAAPARLPPGILP